MVNQYDITIVSHFSDKAWRNYLSTNITPYDSNEQVKNTIIKALEHFTLNSIASMIDFLVNKCDIDILHLIGTGEESTFIFALFRIKELTINDPIETLNLDMFRNRYGIDTLKIPKTVKYFKSFLFDENIPLRVTNLIFDGTEEQFSNIKNSNSIKYDKLTTN